MGSAALSAALAGVALPATAQDLLGQWHFLRQGYNGQYTGTLIIAGGSEVRLKGRSPMQDYSECGYVEVKGDKIEIVFTSAKASFGYSVDHFSCTASTDKALSCRNRDAAGHGGEAEFTILHIGRLPPTAAGRFEDVCPPREQPRS